MKSRHDAGQNTFRAAQLRPHSKRTAPCRRRATTRPTFTDATGAETRSAPRAVAAASKAGRGGGVDRIAFFGERPHRERGFSSWPGGVPASGASQQVSTRVTTTTAGPGTGQPDRRCKGGSRPPRLGPSLPPSPELPFARPPPCPCTATPTRSTRPWCIARWNSSSAQRTTAMCVRVRRR